MFLVCTRPLLSALLDNFMIPGILSGMSRCIFSFVSSSSTLILRWSISLLFVTASPIVNRTIYLGNLAFDWVLWASLIDTLLLLQGFFCLTVLPLFLPSLTDDLLGHIVNARVLVLFKLKRVLKNAIFLINLLHLLPTIATAFRVLCFLFPRFTICIEFIWWFVSAPVAMKHVWWYWLGKCLLLEALLLPMSLTSPASFVHLPCLLVASILKLINRAPHIHSFQLWV